MTTINEDIERLISDLIDAVTDGGEWPTMTQLRKRYDARKISL